MRSFCARWLTCAFLVTAALVPMAKGDGLIVIHDPPHMVPHHFRFAPLEVEYHRVDVTIEDRVATTKIDQAFRNPNNARLEGTYLFPLPKGAHIDQFVMDVNGKPMEAELLDADKARRVYEEIVRKARDPALLEYVGQGALKVRIFPIEPHSVKKIGITYTETLNTDSGISEYVYPLNTEKFSSRPIREVSVRVDIRSRTPIKSLTCPSHNVDIRREGAQRAILQFSERDSRPDSDLKVIFSTEPRDTIGIDLLTYQDGREDGYFMLMASPGMLDRAGKAMPKDICFVMDTSGSMAGKKIDQARKALTFCLDNLNEGDRFDVIRFSTEAETLFGALVPADKEHVRDAQTFVDGLKPIGGTAIHEALSAALALRSNRTDELARPYLVVFVTDGLPTIGEAREDKIVEAVRGGGRDTTTRIFSFGLGTDVNTHLLDRIAEDTRGRSQYVLPEEDLELKLSAFYRKISEPVMADIRIEATTSNIRLSAIQPHILPDLFNGDTLLVFGRYQGDGASAIRMSGILAGAKRKLMADATFARQDTKHDYIPRLWATRRVGWLLDEIRRNGETRELKDEVTRLARAHGIVTPYTAYLIMEDEALRGVPVTRRNFREFEADRVDLDGTHGVFVTIRREVSLFV